MILFTLILSCITAGALACNDERCEIREIEDELMAVRMLPNKEQLRTICPKAFTFLECEKDQLECSGQSLEELVLSSDEEKAFQARAMLTVISLVRDVCDEDSSLHQDYVGSVDCFRDSMIPAIAICRENSMKPIENFFSQQYSTEPTNAEIRCLSDVLEIACLIDNLGDSCGSVAHRLAMTVLDRMGPVVKAKSCPYVENAADLKSKFLDFLELEDEKKSKYQGIFDLLKRRR